MDKIEAYEFAGIIAPGAVTIFGLSRIYPELGLLMNDDKISFGEFGLLLIARLLHTDLFSHVISVWRTRPVHQCYPRQSSSQPHR